MSKTTDTESKDTRENLPEVPSLFSTLFGIDTTSQKYLADLRVAREYLAALEGTAEIQGLNESVSSDTARGCVFLDHHTPIAYDCGVR